MSAGASGAAVAQSSSVGSLTVVGTLDSTDVAPSTITIVPDPAQTGPAEAGSTTWVDGPLIPNAAAPTSIAAAAESIGLSLDLPPLPGPDRIEVNEAPMPVERRAMAARFADAEGRYWWLRIDPWDPSAPPSAVIDRDRRLSDARQIDVGGGYPASVAIGTDTSKTAVQIHEVRDGHEWSFFTEQVPADDLIAIVTYVNGGPATLALPAAAPVG